ncbi:uncharacterized protein LOC109849343 [Asparagus officinalis]|uniref:uncharacterized protein LOC109849343 n=1 Tax=Asparagus officinalis TaxID=4686 RepID=UPI00098E846E|nr:uncharacterized protein LOC109849343 [Asparagus officinalis]
MAQGPKSVASLILFINLIMYAVVAAIAAWALNYGIEETPDTVKSLTLPARLFPIYYPIGNLATGFFVMFSLIAGLVGIAASLSGLHNVLEWRASSLLSASASSVIALGLTLLAMGLAWKEITISPRAPSLRAMETLTFILSATQLLCTGAIHAGVTGITTYPSTGRV